jgi:hypothetical protein
LRSPFSGRIIGMARNQIVMPGFAAFHIGIQTDETPTERAADNKLSQEQRDELEIVDRMSEEEE